MLVLTFFDMLVTFLEVVVEDLRARFFYFLLNSYIHYLENISLGENLNIL